jgi:hypothetical protein
MNLPDFEGLLALLTDQGIPFVVVGGYSAMLHGSALMTRDLDIACPMTPEVLGKLQKALVSYNPVHRMHPERPPFTAEQATAQTWRNLYLDTDLGVLDCLGEIRGIGGFDSCLARSVSLDLGAFRIQVLGIEALIDAKRAMGRPRDLHTAEELEAIQRLNP